MSIRPLRSFTVLLALIFTLVLATPAIAQGFLLPPDGAFSARVPMVTQVSMPQWLG